MKVFIDTNVLVAAYISHGACFELYEHCLDTHTVYSSEQVRRELEDTLTKKLRFSAAKAATACKHHRENSILTRPIQQPHGWSRDPDDDNIIAAAIQIPVDCIVTGDKDLLVLERVQGIPVLSPGDFWKFENAF